MSTRYGSDETWPRHQKSWWSEALADARAAGWTLHYIDAPHRFGIVSCPCSDENDRHQFAVDKTARGGETISKEARKLIRSCRHGLLASGAKVQARQDECGRLLDEAERLIALADGELTLAEAREAAFAELERLEVQLETAAANVAEALREEQEGAWRAALDAAESPDPDSIAAVLDDATTAVAGTETVATALKIRKPKLAKPFLDRAQAAHARIDELWDRLNALY